MRAPVKVFIIDPDPLARRALTDALSQRPELVVLGAAATPGIAARRCANMAPEVLVMDIEPPLGDNLDTLRRLRDSAPLPCVLYTALDSATLDRIERHPVLAARHVIAKPEAGLAEGVLRDTDALSEAILRLAVYDRLRHEKRPGPESCRGKATAFTTKRLETSFDRADWIIAIGASTGGTQALAQVLQDLPPTSPGVVIVQHMPSDFTGPFARRLNACCALDVREAAGGEIVTPGAVLIAHGGQHLEINGAPGNYRAALVDGPKVSGHRPSVDLLFRSVARAAGRNAVGVLLTGMGEDGAAGLLDMRRAGARTLAQDEQSSIVFGMPRAAYENQAAEELVPLARMAERIIDLLG